MNNTESEALYQKAMRFSQEDSSVAGEAARQLALVLETKIKQTEFRSDNFRDNALDFLSIQSEKLRSLDGGNIIRFFEQCREHEANQIVERFVAICTSLWFTISIQRLSFLGEQLAKVGFKQDGARCFDRAKELALASNNEKDESAE